MDSGKPSMCFVAHRQQCLLVHRMSRYRLEAEEHHSKHERSLPHVRVSEAEMFHWQVDGLLSERTVAQYQNPAAWKYAMFPPLNKVESDHLRPVPRMQIRWAAEDHMLKTRNNSCLPIYVLVWQNKILEDHSAKNTHQWLNKKMQEEVSGNNSSHTVLYYSSYLENSKSTTILIGLLNITYLTEFLKTFHRRTLKNDIGIRQSSIFAPDLSKTRENDMC